MGEAMTEYEGNFVKLLLEEAETVINRSKIRVRRMRRWLLIWIKVWA